MNLALDISKAFDRVWHASLLHKRKSYGISGWIFGLIWLYVVLGGSVWKVFTRISSYCWSSPKVHSFLILFLLYINDFPDDFIYNIATYADDTTLYSKCG